MSCPLSVAEMRKHIGCQIGPLYSAEEVSMWGIKIYCEATGDKNPLWTDAEYAAKSRWMGITAPPTYVWAFNPSNYNFRESSDWLPEGKDLELPFALPYAGQPPRLR